MTILDVYIIGVLVTQALLCLFMSYHVTQPSNWLNSYTERYQCVLGSVACAFCWPVFYCVAISGAIKGFTEQ